MMSEELTLASLIYFQRKCISCMYTYGMMVFEYGVVVRPVVRNDHAPPPSLASVLIRGVEKVAVKEDSVAGFELAIDAIELPLRPLHPLGIGSALRGVAFSNGGKSDFIVSKL